jgi:hypothetical protein
MENQNQEKEQVQETGITNDNRQVLIVGEW